MNAANQIFNNSVTTVSVTLYDSLTLYMIICSKHCDQMAKKWHIHTETEIAVRLSIISQEKYVPFLCLKCNRAIGCLVTSIRIVKFAIQH